MTKPIKIPNEYAGALVFLEQLTVQYFRDNPKAVPQGNATTTAFQSGYACGFADARKTKKRKKAKG